MNNFIKYLPEWRNCAEKPEIFDFIVSRASSKIYIKYSLINFRGRRDGLKNIRKV
jgi:hypothetical protein